MRCVVISTFAGASRKEKIVEDAPEIARAHLFIFCEKSVEKIWLRGR